MGYCIRFQFLGFKCGSEELRVIVLGMDAISKYFQLCGIWIKSRVEFHVVGALVSKAQGFIGVN